MRRIPWAFDDVRADNWNRDAFQGMQLKGKTLGIIGFGRVGIQMKMMARDGFRMETLVNDRKLFLSTALKDVLRRSDILTIHVPLNDETRGMLDAEKLLMLPWGAYVVNTSRAEIVDTDAMIDLLNTGHIAGYATDFPFPLHPKVLQTPHLGGNTKEAREMTDGFMQAKLEHWLKEHEPSAV